jgi:hypothetical protein
MLMVVVALAANAIDVNNVHQLCTHHWWFESGPPLWFAPLARNMCNRLIDQLGCKHNIHPVSASLLQQMPLHRYCQDLEQVHRMHSPLLLH